MAGVQRRRHRACRRRRPDVHRYPEGRPPREGTEGRPAGEGQGRRAGQVVRRQVRNSAAASGGLPGMTARGAAAVFAVILVATLAADQGSKAWARTLPVHPAGCDQPAGLLAGRCIGMPQSVVDGYWDWELAYNLGVAFSTFASFAGSTGMRVMLLVIAVVALIGITLLALRARP